MGCLQVARIRARASIRAWRKKRVLIVCLSFFLAFFITGEAFSRLQFLGKPQVAPALGNNRLHYRAERPLAPFPVDLPASRQVDPFTPIRFVKVQDEGASGVKGGMDELFFQVDRRAVKEGPAHLNARYMVGLAPVGGALVPVVDRDAAPGSGIGDKLRHGVRRGDRGAVVGNMQAHINTLLVRNRGSSR